MAININELAKIVGTGNVIDDRKTLESYSADSSFVIPCMPGMVVKPDSADEVAEIVKWANRTGTPLVPLSSGPPHFHGDTVPILPGTVIVDISRMKNIGNIDRRNRYAVIEPGVTFGQLKTALASEGMCISAPLLPRRSKSVIASLLEREVTLIPRYRNSMLEPLRALTVVWGNGERFNTGSAGSSVHPPLITYGPGQADWTRFIAGAQGSMGIVTQASLRCKVLPQVHRLYFVASERLESLIDFAYKVLRIRYGDELLIFNSTNLAYILGEGNGEVGTLRDKLPRWILILGFAGRSRLPEERVEFQYKDVTDIARQFGLNLLPAITGATGEEVLEAILNPSREPYWKLNYKGGCQDIFFLTTLNRAPEFIKTMYSAADEQGYPVTDIGVYLQPEHMGVCCHCEFNLPYDQGRPEEVAAVKELYIRASGELMKQGAFFSRPYGIWADMVYGKDTQTASILKKVKGIFDPNNVMNPGRLCFTGRKTEEA